MYIGVAISGGIDSLASLILLKSLGHQVLALHGLLLELSNQERETFTQKLTNTCQILGVPLKIVDLRAEFQKLVIKPTLWALNQGDTPNPCVLCNREIKFGLLFDYALKQGCDFWATGHYANLSVSKTGLRLKQAKDLNKDQSYFLSLIAQKTLDKLIFPLGNHTKEEVRHLIKAQGLAIPQPKESQDVCFYPPNPNLAPFLEQKWAAWNLPKPKPGPIYLYQENNPTFQEIGLHQGLWRYTEGQRRGLGLPYKEGLYVLKKDKSTNSLIVGTRANLGMTFCRALSPNLFYDLEPNLKKLLVKLRYRQAPIPCDLTLSPNSLDLNFSDPVFPTSQGQLASVLDLEGHILAGGIVTELKVKVDQ